MCENNNTAVIDIVLLGFQNLYSFRIPLFITLLIIYIIILIGNISIIVLVLVSNNLKFPMYIFLQNLALADTLFSTTIVPQLLYIVLWGELQIFLTRCIIQFYIYSFFGISQCFLLTAMSYDRYLAICDPLHYSSLMDLKNCYKLIYLSWFLSFALDSNEMICIFQLHFCHLNIIDHFFCDLTPILTMSSSDATIIIWQDLVLSIVTILLPLLFVVASYICILITIHKMTTTIGRKKAFSTCSSHLLIVCIYYGSLIALYMVPSGDNFSNQNKFKFLINTLLTPFSNPLIYSVRNKEIMGSFNKLIANIRT